MIEIYHIVVGVCIGVACALPFTYKTFVKSAKNRVLKKSITRLNDFVSPTDDAGEPPFVGLQIPR